MKSPESEAVDFQSQYRSLQRLCVGLLISNLLIGGALGLFLLRQVFALNRQVVEVNRFVENYKTNAMPQVGWFISNLQAFAKTNTDFNPILAKYNLLPATSAAPAAPAAPIAPAPKAPAPKK